MSVEWATQAARESVVAGSESAEWMAESVAAEPAVSARHGANSNDTSSNKDANYTEREMGGRRKRARKARETTRDAAEEAVSRAASETADTAQPIHANLIQFPRELVATRKVRPRRAEGPYAAMTEQGGQLSIFEVDPGAFTMEAAQTSVLEEAAAPAWKGPEWSGIKLDARCGNCHRRIRIGRRFHRIDPANQPQRAHHLQRVRRSRCAWLRSFSALGA